MSETVEEIRAKCQAGVRQALQEFDAEVIDEVMARVEALVYRDRESYVEAVIGTVTAMITSVLESKIGALKAEAAFLRQLETFRHMVTSDRVH